MCKYGLPAHVKLFLNGDGGKSGLFAPRDSRLAQASLFRKTKKSSSMHLSRSITCLHNRKGPGIAITALWEGGVISKNQSVKERCTLHRTCSWIEISRTMPSNQHCQSSADIYSWSIAGNRIKTIGPPHLTWTGSRRGCCGGGWRCMGCRFRSTSCGHGAASWHRCSSRDRKGRANLSSPREKNG